MRLSEQPESLNLVRKFAIGKSRKYPWAEDEIKSNCNLALVMAEKYFDPSAGIPWNAYLIRGCELALLKALQSRRLKGVWDLARKRNRRLQVRFSEIADDFDPGSILGADRSPDKLIDGKDLMGRVLSTLHPTQREVIVGRVILGEAFDEIWQLLGFSKQRARQHYDKALTRIAERNREMFA